MSESRAIRSLMHLETEEAGTVARQIAQENRSVFAEVACEIVRRDINLVLTNGRGSSDHASVFGKYLIMQKLGLPVASGAPSIASIHGRLIAGPNSLCLSISQSGGSDDIVKFADHARSGGAYSVALINQANSPLEAATDKTIPLCAGEEKSVAATKTYIASLVSIIWLVAYWAEDQDLICQLESLPDLLEEAATLDWSSPLSMLKDYSGLSVIGRGLGLGIANEAALKFKETCQIHAEAFSSAEYSHGPLALSGPEFPALVFAQDDDTLVSTRGLAKQLLDVGAPVLLAGAEMPGAISLPTIDAPSALQPLLMIQSFYSAVADLSLELGLDPDSPPVLRKVTKTL